MAGMVCYRVLRKCFVNGSLYDPAMSANPIYVDGPPGLESDALALAPAAGKPGQPGRTLPPSALPGASPVADPRAARIAELEHQVAAAEDAVHTLQARLDAVRAETSATIEGLKADKVSAETALTAAANRIAELEAAIAAAEAATKKGK